MKKITLIVFVAMLAMYVNAATTLYLVSNNGTTWSGQTPANTGFDAVTAVDLSSPAQTLNAWCGTLSINAGDQVWVAGGTYYMTAVYSYPSVNFVICGGFAGTETATSGRAKGTNVWDFTNETIIRGDGGTPSTTGAFTSGGDRVNAIFDGLTIQGFSTTQALYARAAIVRYCKFISNTYTGLNINTTTSGNSASCDGCYFYSNSASGATQSPSLLTSPAAGGTVTIKNCTFESNSQTTTSTSSAGAGIRAAGAGTTNISNCIVRNNSAAAGGASGISLGSATASISNCLVYGNTGKVGLYITAGNVYNCTFVNNTTGGAYIATAGPSLYNTVFWGTDGGATSGSGFINSVANTTSLIKNCAYAGINANYTGTPVSCIVLPQTNTGTGAPYFVDPTINDWHLGSQSSLLDKGDGTIVGSPTTDIAGIARPQGTKYDIGAYELPYYGTTVTFNANGTVNAYTTGDIDSEPQGTQLAFTISPNSGYKITSVLYNGTDVTASLVSGVYTAPALVASANLVVQFDLATSVNKVSKIISCFATKNSVELRGIAVGDDVSVYSVTGARLFNAKALNSEMSIPVGRGIFIVKTTSIVTKIVVE